MTKRGSRRAAARTSLCLLAALVLSCATSGINRAHAFPQPQPQPQPLPPGLFYGDSADEAENLVNIAYMLVNRLKQLIEQKHRVVEQKHEITDEQIEIQEILEPKAREQEREPEFAMSMEQPPDYTLKHVSPKIGDMSLCHFKICNMGKRQSK